MACIQPKSKYVLINVAGGTCMDLSGGDNRSIIGYPYHGGLNQQWIFENAGGAHIRYVKSAGSEQYLSVDGEIENGQKVVASETPYPWRVVDDPTVQCGIRLFPVSDTDFCVDLSDHGNSTPGTPVELWAEWDGKNQIWKLQQA